MAYFKILSQLSPWMDYGKRSSVRRVGHPTGIRKVRCNNTDQHSNLFSEKNHTGTREGAVPITVRVPTDFDSEEPKQIREKI